MKIKNDTDSLNELIITLENKRAYELESLKDQLHVVCESLKPKNLMKSLFHSVTDSPEIKNSLVSNVIGLGTGFLSKKVVMGNPDSTVKKILGTLIQFGVANTVAKHTDDIKAIGISLLKRFLKPKKVKKE